MTWCIWLYYKFHHYFFSQICLLAPGWTLHLSHRYVKNSSYQLSHHQRAFLMWKNWENICYTSKCVWSWSSYSYPWNLDDMKEARLSQCIFPIIRLYSFLYSRKWQGTICPIQDMATRVDNTNHISSNVSILAPSVCWTGHHGVKELIPIQYGNIYL